MKRRFLAGLMSLAVSLALCSCNGESSHSGSSSFYGEVKKNENIIICGEDKEYEVFDTIKIANAFKNGQSENLDETEKKILERASEIYKELDGDNLSDIEYELAVYEYFLENCTYDNEAIDVFGKPQEGSETPYGMLLENRGICLGYATTFQLFMEMKGIPCLLIYATDDENEEHAWNQVSIDDNWYYVDMTWDDPVPDYEGRKPYHEYFNVTEQEMIKSGHVWESSLCNEATATEHAYYKLYSHRISQASEVMDIIAASGRAEEIYFSAATDLLTAMEIVGDDFYGAVYNVYIDEGIYYFRVQVAYF